MGERQDQAGRILIIDDQEANVTLLRRILAPSKGYQISSVTDPREAEAAFDEFEPDLILLDLHMPELSGLDLLGRFRAKIPDGDFLPILILTADAGQEPRQACLAGGAKDFLTKPFDSQEVLLRIHNLLETRTLHLALKNHNRTLEAEVRIRTRELEEARNQVLERLAMAAEYRDDATGGHIQRVGKLTTDLARVLGMSELELDLLTRTAPLHDVGKIGVPDSILLKPGKLTPDEFELVKAHTAIGARIFAGDQFPLLQMAARIALTHHERWDGNGYPQRLAGEAIPVEGRIVAVADTFDALTNERPYKKAWPFGEAVAEIAAQREKQFDPQVVDAFLGLMEYQQPVGHRRGA